MGPKRNAKADKETQPAPKKRAHAKHIKREPIHRPELDFIIASARAEAESDLKEAARRNTEIMAELHNKLAVCIILFSTGLRLNEALYLNKDQLERLTRGEPVKLHINKQQAPRFIQFSPAAQTLWQENLPEDYLTNLPDTGLCNCKGDKLLVRTADRWLRPFFEQLHERHVGQANVRLAGVCYGIHSFRIGWITRTNAATGDIAKTLRLVGHADISTTIKYLRGDDQQVLLRELMSSNPEY